MLFATCQQILYFGYVIKLFDVTEYYARKARAINHVIPWAYIKLRYALGDT